MQDVIKEAGDESSITRGNLQLRWTNIDEGYNGDYDPEDSTDANLLRFDLFEKKGTEWEEWNEGSNYSYCTNFLASCSDKEKISALKIMMDVLYPLYLREQSKDETESMLGYGDVKHALQKLSWIEVEWLQDPQHYLNEVGLNERN